MNNHGPGHWAENRERSLFCLLFLLGTVLRFYGLGKRQLWLDEIIQLQCFSHPTFQENLAAVAQLVAPAPLDFIVQDFFVTLGGRSEVATRFHATLFGSLSLPLFYLLARQFFPARVSLIGLLLFAIYPLHHHYSQEGRPYALLVFLTLCAYYSLTRALASKGYGWWLLFSVIAAMLLYTHYLAGILLVAQGAFLLCLLWPRVTESLPFPLGSSAGRQLLSFILSAGAAGLLFLPWLVLTFEKTQWHTPGISADLPLLLRIVREISGGGYPLSLILLFGFFFGVRHLVRVQRWAAACLLLSWFLLPLLIILFLDWYRDYFFAIRQILYATPALYLGLALGLDQLPGLLQKESAGPKLQVTVLLVTALLSLSAIYRHRGREDADWKSVAAYLQAHLRSQDLVSAPHTSRWLGFYVPEIERRHVEVEQLTDRARIGSCQGAPGERSLYLVESIYMTPAQKDVAQRLLAVACVRERHQFKGFAVSQLELRRETDR